MSCEPFVRAKGLGKKYPLYKSAAQRVGDLMFDWGSAGEHWAVRDIDLDLRPGTCLGIVGRNGAGKSTLLELISGILHPSEGVIETSGRIAALLQLGAGFSPDFTGRENVLLGASLFGLSDSEIRQRFASIEALAGIGSYIDRPVREYSSGMFARLAFSVCAHVDADILVVDEILGIGDVAFQQKSMRLLRRFRRSGIVLFVSHDEHAVAALCDSAVWIDDGRIVARGDTKDVLYLYHREMARQAWPEARFVTADDPGIDLSLPVRTEASSLASSDAALSEFDLDEPDVSGRAVLERAEVAVDGRPLSPVGGGERFELDVTARATEPLAGVSVMFALRNPMGQVVFCRNSREPQDEATDLMPGQRLSVRFVFDLPYLPTGSYPLEVFLFADADGGRRCEAFDANSIMVQVLSAHISQGLANLATEARLEVDREYA